MNYLKVIGLILAISGCSTNNLNYSTEKQARDSVFIPFEQGAITLNIQTDTNLNSLDGIANSCTLLMIQTKTNAEAKKLLSDPAVLREMFNGDVNKENILKVDQYSTMPGQNITLHIDRSENAHYLTVVAGYYPFPTLKNMKISDIPIKANNSSWFGNNWFAKPMELVLNIRLGSESITEFEK
ncbi:hypothetical protein DVH07_18345 [Hafnia paralvei]|uniref:type VI secretion lipoprotein TssJ n=1 Tax=Hafnia paralvei TaxID=546367 RepID=UPI000DF333D4|nr:type VI secretion lipoprotein TssJ [Hafnia paralvei]RDA61910.1 hypothetical protein DU449_17905 [Hafnia paralvei]RDA62971.1 hypothetical protein DVH08_20115 [Hafnia paralvei]RDA63811.1 hypothetical protein DVH09_18475 [Hafnia paralvei]RDA75097.1 hypothetical protein DVH10_17645 [Hafnia paralvei]RDA75501.1 hypothetical protein DVH07_18345 [Hafnia paralvei]